MKPTLKQRHFVQEYLLNGGNGAEAAMKAYKTTSRRTACAIAYENLRKPALKQLIDQYVQQTHEATVFALSEGMSGVLRAIQSAVTDLGHEKPQVRMQASWFLLGVVKKLSNGGGEKVRKRERRKFY